MRRMPRRSWAIGCLTLSVVVALAACGGSSTSAPTGAAPSANATGRGTPGAVTNPTPTTDPPRFERTINGEVAYAGTRLGAHKIVITASLVGAQGTAYTAAVTRPGKYSLTGVADGIYAVLAFIDLGDDLGTALPSEPQGVFGSTVDGKPSPVVIKDGNAPTGINITIVDR